MQETAATESIFAFDSINIQWLAFLFAALLFSILGVLFPNWFKEVGNPRPHNRIKLLNECLARHQFAYFAYFFALSVGVTFGPGLTWVKNVLWSALGLSFGFYGYGLFSATLQDKKIAKHHMCPKDRECETQLPFGFCMRLCGLNIVFALLSAVSAILIALLAR